MADETGKGSIFLKLIIVVLIAVLVAAIMIPKQMWDEEDKNTEICRQRMVSLQAAELLFHSNNSAYCPDLDSLLDFFKTDPVAYELDFVKLDTFLGVQLLGLVEDDDYVKVTMDTILADTTMKDILRIVEIDYYFSNAMVNVIKRHDRRMAEILKPILTENEEDKMASSMAIKELASQMLPIDIMTVLKKDDSLKTVIKDLQPELSMEHFLQDIKRKSSVATRIDSFFTCFLDSLEMCPTVHKPYKIAVVGSTIVRANIACPITAEDSLAVENDFYRKKIGGMTLQNHGRIENGEYSWKEL